MPPTGDWLNIKGLKTHPFDKSEVYKISELIWEKLHVIPHQEWEQRSQNKTHENLDLGDKYIKVQIWLSKEFPELDIWKYNFVFVF